MDADTECRASIQQAARTPSYLVMKVSEQAGPEKVPFVTGSLFTSYRSRYMHILSYVSCEADELQLHSHCKSIILSFRPRLFHDGSWDLTISWCDVFGLSFALLHIFPHAETLLMTDNRIHGSHAKSFISCRLG